MIRKPVSYFVIHILKESDMYYTVKPSHEATSVKQSPALKGRQSHMNLTSFMRPLVLGDHLFCPKCDSYCWLACIYLSLSKKTGYFKST